MQMSMTADPNASPHVFLTKLTLNLHTLYHIESANELLIEKFHNLVVIEQNFKLFRSHLSPC